MTRPTPKMRLADFARGPKTPATVDEWDVTPGLHEWIEQQIAEVERALRGVEKEQGRIWATRWDARTDSVEIIDQAGSLVAANVLPSAAAWMELAAPTRGYARCAADRKILAAHPYTTRVVNPSYGKHAGFGCETCHDWDGVPEGRGNCATILALAEAYGLEPAGAEDAAKETEELLVLLNQWGVRAEVRRNRLAEVWKAVEWWDSSDSGEEDVHEALAAYRGEPGQPESDPS